MSAADDPRFSTFVASTNARARDWIAFIEFEQAIHDAGICAGTLGSGGLAGDREHAYLKLALSEMLLRVLPRVDFGTLLAYAEGIGYALRHGVIEPKPEALDHVADTEAYSKIAKRGYGAQADADWRAAHGTTRKANES